MTIHNRIGSPVTIVRVATLVDVERLEYRRPDFSDRQHVAGGAYLVTRNAAGAEHLIHRMDLTADGGSREIADAVETLEKVVPA